MEWDPYKSKLAASIRNGLQIFPIVKKTNILYITSKIESTILHISDIIGENGRIFLYSYNDEDLEKIISDRNNIGCDQVIFIDKDKSVWCSTFGDGVLHLSEEKEIYYSIGTGLISDNIRAFTKTIQKDIGLDSLEPLFHSVYYSNVIGMRKPTKEAFKYVLEQNDYIPEETLFLDDSVQHLMGAKKCGIHSIHITDIVVEELFADFLT